MPEPFIDDPDFRLYVGDVRDVLAQLPDESIDCCITSPPYFGLRDYGTGTWEGGDPDHEHETVAARGGRGGSGTPGKQTEGAFPSVLAVDECSCGARRVDRQIGLEPTVSEYVSAMVTVFREVRRVLAPHGTLWLNLGDSYSSRSTYSTVNTLHEEHDWKREQDHRPVVNATVSGIAAKNLVGVPWRVAFALQDDGWHLRSDIIWSKPNPMPESVTDRPTKSHEYVFMFAKSARYYFDQEAVREEAANEGPTVTLGPKSFSKGQAAGAGIEPSGNGAKDVYVVPAGRNIRTVWEIPTRPYEGAHFATYPPELVRRALLAACPTEVCTTCGKPSERIVEKGEPVLQADTWSASGAAQFDAEAGEYVDADSASTLKHVVPRKTVGWTDCGHDTWRRGLVLDPFMGSGTTALVARDHGRHAVGVELNPEYARLCAERVQQLSLLALA